jgi:hypothetical protein
MKISEMTNDQACDCLIRMTPAVTSILDDKETVDAMLKAYAEGRSKPLYQMIGDILPKFVPFCLKTHKRDLYEIIGALTFKSVKEVGNMNLLETMKVLKESVDEDLIGFFKSSGLATAEPGEE